jgi:hypothetical protein
MGATAETPDTLQAVKYIQQHLIHVYREHHYPIIHIILPYHAEWYNVVDLCNRRSIELGKQLVIPRSDGAELMDELKPLPGY